MMTNCRTVNCEIGIQCWFSKKKTKKKEENTNNEENSGEVIDKWENATCSISMFESNINATKIGFHVFGPHNIRITNSQVYGHEHALKVGEIDNPQSDFSVINLWNSKFFSEINEPILVNYVILLIARLCKFYSMTHRTNGPSVSVIKVLNCTGMTISSCEMQASNVTVQNNQLVVYKDSSGIIHNLNADIHLGSKLETTVYMRDNKYSQYNGDRPTFRGESYNVRLQVIGPEIDLNDNFDDTAMLKELIEKAKSSVNKKLVLEQFVERGKKEWKVDGTLDITGISLMGSLNRSIYSDSESNIKIQFSSGGFLIQGEADSPTKISGLLLHGTSKDKIGTAVKIVNSKNVYFENLKMEEWAKGIVADGFSNLSIDGCKLKFIHQEGVALSLKNGSNRGYSQSSIRNFDAFFDFGGQKGIYLQNVKGIDFKRSSVFGGLFGVEIGEGCEASFYCCMFDKSKVGLKIIGNSEDDLKLIGSQVFSSTSAILFNNEDKENPVNMKLKVLGSNLNAGTICVDGNRSRSRCDFEGCIIRSNSQGDGDHSALVANKSGYHRLIACILRVSSKVSKANAVRVRDGEKLESLPIEVAERERFNCELRGCVFTLRELPLY